VSHYRYNGLFLLDMIFLDEPTSGLDSYTARYLVSNLRDLARRGKIVLLTIHQPSSDIFTMLDNVGIMSRGELVYYGQGIQMVDYFSTLGFPCDKYTNPLDRYGNCPSLFYVFVTLVKYCRWNSFLEMTYCHKILF